MTQIIALMSGNILEIKADKDSATNEHDEVLILESMKNRNTDCFTFS
jgi:biotin carboxyl carrier protein